MSRRLLAAACLMLSFSAVNATERWQTLPPVPAPVAGAHGAYANVKGVKIYYSKVGQGSPVVLLHSGLAHGDYFGNQINALKGKHTVITIDSRGHGRSGRDSQPFGYDLMADDVVAVLDSLNIKRADIVGWSDGGIIGIDLALRHPERIGKVFAFAPNTQTSGVKDGVEKNPTFAAFIERNGKDYARLSPTPKEFDAFVEQISHMWASQPNWTDAQLQSIKTPILIADGDHDEAIKREHIEYMAATIPGAGLLILPNTSHFAMLQDPALFNAAVSDFLDSK
ncbi:alpha/beta fold hydrolase [Pseudomonas sp. SDO528_S397]